MIEVLPRATRWGQEMDSSWLLRLFARRHRRHDFGGLSRRGLPRGFCQSWNNLRGFGRHGFRRNLFWTKFRPALTQEFAALGVGRHALDAAALRTSCHGHREPPGATVDEQERVS